MTFTLHETLSELARLLPERVRQVDDGSVRTNWYVRFGPDRAPKHEELCAVEYSYEPGVRLLRGGSVLEYALREEIDDLGWQWVTQQFLKKFEPERAYKALVYRPGLPADAWGKQLGFVEMDASTPAHALAAALVLVLEAK